MIIGTGIDISHIDRIANLITRWGDLFTGRVFTKREIEWCRRRVNPPECFALRFAAKEALLKAIGTGLREGIRWTDIEVENEPSGRPCFAFHRRTKEILSERGVRKAFLTLSHERPFAVAHVLLEGEDESSDL